METNSKITHTEAEVKEFPIRIDEFKNKIKLFYECGTSFFLTKVEVGDQETYYLHALWCYIPNMAEDTWTTHKCGICVFTMQGYERRKKSLKT